jgi:hypothetical protein
VTHFTTFTSGGAVGLKVQLASDASGDYVQVVAVDGSVETTRAAYLSGNGKLVSTETSLDSLFSDDFGGNTVDLTRWDVLDGGLAANANLGFGVFTQAKIGSGIIGMTDSVATSGLTVNMGTTLGAERWYLSKQSFAGKEDVLILLSKSISDVNNSIFIGLVEVDPTTFVPLLNPNFTADGNGSFEFTNRGGCEFGLSATTTAYRAEAIGDSSSAKAAGVIGVAAAWTTTQEVLIEIDSRDITVSTATIDVVTAKAAGGSRVSSQCPNDKKLYKLIMRFKNVGTPAATSVVIQRVLVVDNYEQRVQISSGEGDQIQSKGVPVNVAGIGLVSPNFQGAAADNGNVLINPVQTGGWMTSALIAVGTTARLGKATMDLGRRPIIKAGGIPQAHAFGSAVLATTTETTLLAAVALERYEVQSIECVNFDTVAHTFIFRDATAGTIRWKIYVPAGDTRGREFPAGLCATALNANFTVQLGEVKTTTSPEVYASSYLGTA